MTFLLANLSLADFLVLLVCMPSAAVDLYAKEVWYFGGFLCKYLSLNEIKDTNDISSWCSEQDTLIRSDLILRNIHFFMYRKIQVMNKVSNYFVVIGTFVPYLENVVALESVLTILAISYDRYRGICFPMKLDIFWLRINVAYVIAITWIVAGISGLPFLFMAKHKDSKFVDGTDIKVCRIPINESWKIGYILVTFGIFIVIFFILLYLIGCMCRSLLDTSTLIDNVDLQMRRKFQERRRVVTMLVIVIALFFACLLPQRVVGIWFIFATKKEIASLGFEGYLNLITFTRIAMFLNSSVNPVIYNTLSASYKAALREVICRTAYAPGHEREIARYRCPTITIFSPGEEEAVELEDFEELHEKSKIGKKNSRSRFLLSGLLAETRFDALECTSMMQISPNSTECSEFNFKLDSRPPSQRSSFVRSNSENNSID